jgi:hypothetical protein
MQTFFPDYTSYPPSYPRPILLLEDIDSYVFFSLSPRFLVLAAKKGEKIQFLVILFVVLLALYFSFIISLLFIVLFWPLLWLVPSY